MVKCCFLFEALSEEETAFMLAHSTIRSYQPGEVIFMEDDPSDAFSFILDGQVEIIKSFQTELERQINVLKPGEFMGEMSLVYSKHRRTASARAASAVRMLNIKARDFEQLVKANAQLSYQLMQILIERVMENETATIRDLREKNQLLSESLAELQAAQEQIIANERIETELSTARQIQESMLPDEIPNLPGWALAAHWQPARAVSGDFYDFVPLPDGRLAIVVGDVTDKGVPAALLMTVTRSTVRTAAALAATPGELLARSNDILCPQMPLSMFVTCQVAFLDPATGRLEIANGGHPLPLLYRDGQVSEIHVTGLALGVFPDMVYEVKEVMLQPGERMLFYSDGLSEAFNERGTMLGSAGARRLFEQGANQAQPMIDFLLERFNEFVDPAAQQDDDITLVSLKRL